MKNEKTTETHVEFFQSDKMFSMVFFNIANHCFHLLYKFGVSIEQEFNLVVYKNGYFQIAALVGQIQRSILALGFIKRRKLVLTKN